MVDIVPISSENFSRFENQEKAFKLVKKSKCKSIK